MMIKDPDGHSVEFAYAYRSESIAPKTGVMHHMARGVPSVEVGYKALLDRGVKVQQEPQIGRDGKWQLNLYDPNLTRAERMEPKPVREPCCSPMK